MPVLEPIERVLGVAEVPVERPVAQLEEVLHRRALAAPAAPRARQTAVGPGFDKNGHLEVLAISKTLGNFQSLCEHEQAAATIRRSLWVRGRVESRGSTQATAFIVRTHDSCDDT